MTLDLPLAELSRHVGREVAVSPWFEVTQAVIDEFADATLDSQWIHVDTGRAARESPFRNAAGERCTVAHGFLTLSLLTHFIESSINFTGVQAGVNVGFERVRFLGPVPAGCRLRGRFTLEACEEVRGGAQLTWDVKVEREGEPRPVLSATWLTRLWR